MNKFNVSEKQLLNAIMDTIADFDCDDLACLAEDLLGGDINYNPNDDNFEVTPNKDYFGALDKKELN